MLVSQGILKGLLIYLGSEYARVLNLLILFLALKNIHLLRVLGKSLRNNAPPTILSNTPSWYFLQYHQRYLLQYATHAAHISTSLTLPILALHPRWHVTLAGRLHNPRQHVNHNGTSLTLVCHQSKHTTNTSRPPTHARHPRHPRYHEQHAISQTLISYTNFTTYRRVNSLLYSWSHVID